MTVSDVYLEIADDALLAADAALDVGAHSKGAFLGYHAFESAGGAYCSSHGVHYPLSHDSKIRTFVQHAGQESYSQHAAQLATAYQSIGRNALMYPQLLPNGAVRRPADVISPAQARRLKGRTQTLVEKVRNGI